MTPIETVFKEDTPDYVHHVYDPQLVKVVPKKSGFIWIDCSKISLLGSPRKHPVPEMSALPGRPNYYKKYGFEIVLDGHRMLFVSDFADPLNSPNDFQDLHEVDVLLVDELYRKISGLLSIEASF